MIILIYEIKNIINKKPYVLNNNKNINDIDHNFLSGIPVINEGSNNRTTRLLCLDNNHLSS